jgi:hypothetical protein
VRRAPSAVTTVDTTSDRRWWIIASTDDSPDRVAGRLRITRCTLCAGLLTVADEDDHIRWHVSLIGEEQR